MAHSNPELNTSGIPLRAAIYCRVSTTGQEDNSSLSTQEDACRVFARDQGWNVVQMFREVFTGTELFERPELSKLRDLVRNDEIDIVLAHALDRLSRDPVHIGVILSEAEHHRVGVRFVTEPLDDSAEGQLIRFVRGYAAKVEHLKITERTTRGKKARVAAGKLLPGGKPMYGYRWKDETKGAFEIDENTAPIIQRIYREITQGKTIRQIAISLTNERVPTPTQRGTRWNTSSIVEMLHRRAYKGEAYGWGWTKGRVRPQNFDINKAIPLPAGTIPELVDPTIWEAAQSILQRNKATAVRSAKHPESALLRGGYIECGYCGTTMRARPTSNGDHEYVCHQSSFHPDACFRHSIRTHILDNTIWELVAEIVKDPIVIRREVERLRQNDPTTHDLEVVDRNIVEIQRQQVNVGRAVALLEDEDALAPLVSQLQLLADRKQRLGIERNHIIQRQESWANIQNSYTDVQKWCDRVAENLEALSYKEKRMILDVLGVKVCLFRADHDPRYVITADIDPQLVSSTSNGIAGWRFSRCWGCRD
jgi:site-specific DNA recombinase